MSQFSVAKSGREFEANVISFWDGSVDPLAAARIARRDPTVAMSLQSVKDKSKVRVSSPSHPRFPISAPRSTNHDELTPSVPISPHPMQARETNARRAEDRKRSVLVLAQRFLLEHNMPDSARALEREGGVPLKTFDAADNASLTHVLAEWEALHEERFGFRPKLTRRADDPPPGSSAAALAATKGKAGAKAGAERRAARIAAEREASRAGITGTNIDEAQASTSTSATGDVLPSDFDVPPGHPSLRRYASDGVAKPAGGTTLSNAMDYVAKRDAERRGDVAPSGTEHLGKTHSESHLDAGGYRGFMNGHQSKHETRLNRAVGEAEGVPTRGCRVRRRRRRRDASSIDPRGVGGEATGAETAADVRRQRRAARPRARHHAGHIHVQPRRPVQRHQRLRRGEAAVERGGGHAGQVSAILPRVTSAVARNTSLRTARDWKDDAGQSRRDGVRHDVLQHQRVQRGVQVAWGQREAGACVVRARAASRAEHGFHGRARRRHERPRRRRIGSDRHPAAATTRVHGA